MTSPSASPPDLRVGIVSWNTADLLERCLDALPAALGDVVAEVVVVDNASGDGSADRAGAHPAVAAVVRNPANVGYAKAMNQALAGSEAPFLLALNPDTQPAPGSLAALLEAARRHPAAGVVVPRLANEDGSVQHSVYRFPSVPLAAAVCFAPPPLQRGRLGRRMLLEAAPPPEAPGPVDWAIGAVHLIRTSALAGEAPYSERWFMYVEDLELCWRLRQRGWAVHLEPEVEVRHVGNASGAQAWGGARNRRWWRATYDFYGQAHGRARARGWAAVNTAGVLVHVAVNRVGAAVGRRGRRDRRRATAAELVAVLPEHARAVVLGPPPPDPPPPDPPASASP